MTDNEEYKSVRNWLEGQRPTREPSKDSTDTYETGFLTSLYELCVACLQRVRQPSHKSDRGEQLRRRPLHDAYERLLLLEDAFSSGKLESCLTDHDDLEREIATSLHDIGRILLRHSTMSNAHQLSRDDSVINSLRSHLEQAKQIIRQDGSDSESADSDSSGDENGHEDASRRMDCSEMLDIRLLGRQVDLLLQLCPSIEQLYSLKHATNLRRPREAPVLEVTAAGSYASAVLAKFPYADSLLVQRLGEANWERHERLRTLEESALLKTAEPQSIAPLPPPRKSQFHPASLFRDSALGSSIVNPIFAHHKTAQSVASHSSFVSSMDGSDKGSLRVPNLPKGASFGGNFECPFCRKQLASIKSRVDWKIHVFSDLQAYICVHNDCSDILATFSTRKAWFEHEMSQHLSYMKFRCKECCEIFDANNDFLRHFVGAHTGPLSKPQIGSSAAADAAIAVLELSSNILCPLCKTTGFITHREYSTHLGRHLEEVSLYSLPRVQDSDHDEEDLSDDNDLPGQKSPSLTVRSVSTQNSGKGTEVNAQGGEYGNALQAASADGNEKVVQILLEKGADVNAQGGHYGNKLQAASARGHKEVVQTLLEEGADINAQGGYYSNALQAASVRGHKEVVQILLEKGADVNAQAGLYGNALQAVSARGHKEVVQTLLEKGADINAQGGLYGNALQAASVRGHKEVVQILLEKGADINAQGGHYSNALQAASARGHEKIVEMLRGKVLSADQGLS